MSVVLIQNTSAAAFFNHDTESNFDFTCPPDTSHFRDQPSHPLDESSKVTHCDQPTSECINRKKRVEHQHYNKCDKVQALQPIFEEYFEAEYFSLVKKNHEKLTVREIVRTCVQNVEEENFHILDLSHVVRQVERWRKAFPRINPFYAVKCNPNEHIVRIMYMMGCGFDCASLNEVQLVTNLCNEVDNWLAEHPHFYEVLASVNEVDIAEIKGRRFCPSTDIIFANPCKQLSHIRHARDNGVTWTTLDSPFEIEKLSRNWKNVKGVIRIKTDDSHSACAFSAKFGTAVDKAREIFEAAKERRVDLVGVSFHVGSGCEDYTSYVKAVKDARRVFDMAEEYGYHFNLLDIGGGFLGKVETDVSVEFVAGKVAGIIDDLFPAHVKVIAEPGRYIAQAVSTLACNIFAKKDLRQENEQHYQKLKEEGIENVERDRDDFHYYLNDGIYGSFNNIYFDHATPSFNTIKTPEEKGEARYKSTIWGPTCDSIDLLTKNYSLPELDAGDWLFFTNFGAYTTAAASQFNGFKATSFKYIWRN